MNFDLRVLSGLHRGAALPLTLNDTLSIGSNESCDVVLVDPGMAEREANVTYHVDGWTLENLNGGAGASFDPPVLLSFGVPVRVGQVCITVCESSSEWQYFSVDDPRVKTSSELITDKEEEVFASNYEDLSQKEIEKVTFQASNVPGENLSHRLESSIRPKVELRGSSIVRVGLIGSVLIACAAYAMTRSPDNLEQDINAKKINEAIAKARFKNNANRAESTKSSTSSADLDLNQLSELLTKRLSDAELTKRLDIQITKDSWIFRGDLDSEERLRLERILATFLKEHPITVPVSAVITKAENTLPFKIQQFSGGALGSVVTDTGDRIFIGDTYMGYRLAGINGGKLTFVGKRTIEVRW